MKVECVSVKLFDCNCIIIIFKQLQLPILYLATNLQPASHLATEQTPTRFAHPSWLRREGAAGRCGTKLRADPLFFARF